MVIIKKEVTRRLFCAETDRGVEGFQRTLSSGTSNACVVKKRSEKKI